MKILIAGVGGTFMGSLAQLLKAAGDEVIGCDHAIYPPMSDVLARENIPVLEGYLPEHLDCNPDLVLVGNALSRGNPLVEEMLRRKLPYASGPGYLRERVLQHKTVIAVTGTHGKTTTTSILAWILECAGFNPSFLIGGVPGNFSENSRLTDSEYFVIEGDEYDTAYFDKRPKMLVYRPDHVIINHLEFDHADIYENLHAIQKQFHFLVRLVSPENHLVVQDKPHIHEVLAKGTWCHSEVIKNIESQKGGFTDNGEFIPFKMLGVHNAENAAAAVHMALRLKVPKSVAIEALQSYQPVKRRLELVATKNGVDFYDDFAHHPTAIALTIQALKEAYGKIAVICDLRSNSMRIGAHKDGLAKALAGADELQVLADENLSWSVKDYVPSHGTVVHSPSSLNFETKLGALVALSNGRLLASGAGA